MSAHCVLNHFIILRSAQQNTDARIFVWPLSIPIESLHVESELAHVLGRESPSLEFKGDKALKIPMVEQQIEFKVVTANLDTNLFSDKGEAISELHKKLSWIQEEARLEVGFTMGFWEIEEVQHIAVLENANRVLRQNSQHGCEFYIGQHCPFKC